jgi:hypothetical protein
MRARGRGVGTAGGGARPVRGQRRRRCCLLDARTLEKFVDELPDMPRLRGYGVAEGGWLVAVNVTIGMYETTWVSTVHTCAEIKFLVTLLCSLKLYAGRHI